ncbi:MAG: PAS domain-containing protein, partial [Actinomycetes bacterium]
MSTTDRQAGGAVPVKVVDVRDPTAPPVAVVDDSWATSVGGPDLVSVVGAMGDLVVVVDSDGSVVACNPSAARATGRPAQEMVGRSVFDLVHPEDQRLAVELYERYTGGSEVFRPAVRLLAPDGRSVTVEFTARRVDHGAHRYLVLNGRTDPLLDAEELVEGLGVGVCICDDQGVVTRSNQTAARLLGSGQVEPRGPVAELPGTFYRSGPGSLMPTEHPLATVLATGRRLEERMVLVGADGARRVVEVEARPVTLRFAGGAAAVLTLNDVTARDAGERELERRATVDDLTGLLNRSTFMKLVESRIDALEPGR